MPKARLFQRPDDPDELGVWSVEVIDRFGDGECELTILWPVLGGPRAGNMPS